MQVGILSSVGEGHLKQVQHERNWKVFVAAVRAISRLVFVLHFHLFHFVHSRREDSWRYQGLKSIQF